MKDLLYCTLFACVTAIFSGNNPPWSCILLPSWDSQCLNPRWYNSPVFYYTCGNIVGSGFSGIVRSFCASKSMPQLAVKTFPVEHGADNDQFLEWSAPQEHAIAERLDHINIITTYDGFSDGECWHQIMEYTPYRLQDLILSDCLSPEEIDTILLEMVEAVAYMHRQGIAHLDVKMTNIMITDSGVAKLIDFGSSYIFNVNASEQVAQTQFLAGEFGTLSYSAPEVLGDALYDPRLADVWALGILYVCMRATCPWWQPRIQDGSFHHFASEGSSVLLKLLPENSRGIIGQMLVIEPDERVTMIETANQVRQILSLSHPEKRGSFHVDSLLRAEKKILSYGYLKE